MAYNFFNLGIIGTEIKRRLDMLKDITGTNGVASTNQLNQEVDTLNNTITKTNSDLSATIETTRSALSNSIKQAINLNSQDGISYLDAGSVSKLSVELPDDGDINTPDNNEDQKDDDISQKVETLRVYVNNLYDGLASSIYTTNQDLNTINDNVNTINQDLNTINDNVNTINQDLNTINDKLTNVEQTKPIVDYVVGYGIYGSNGNNRSLWYRKYRSGICEMWGILQLEYSDSRCLKYWFNLPYQFTQRPTATVSLCNGESNSVGQKINSVSCTTPIDPNTETYRSCFASAICDNGGIGENDTVEVAIHVIGMM